MDLSSLQQKCAAQNAKEQAHQTGTMSVLAEQAQSTGDNATELVVPLPLPNIFHLETELF